MLSPTDAVSQEPMVYLTSSSVTTAGDKSASGSSGYVHDMGLWGKELEQKEKHTGFCFIGLWYIF